MLIETHLRIHSHPQGPHTRYMSSVVSDRVDRPRTSLIVVSSRHPSHCDFGGTTVPIVRRHCSPIVRLSSDSEMNLTLEQVHRGPRRLVLPRMNTSDLSARPPCSRLCSSVRPSGPDPCGPRIPPSTERGPLRGSPPTAKDTPKDDSYCTPKIHLLHEHDCHDFS